VAAEVSLPADPQASAGILSTGWAVSDLARTASIQTAAARIVAADVSRGKDTPDVEYTLAIKVVGPAGRGRASDIKGGILFAVQQPDTMSSQTQSRKWGHG
jgi:hypothetical protein